MTEKELYKMAMKNNLDDPAEMTAAELRGTKTKTKKNYGYVRSNTIRIAAVAAAAAVAIGAGTVFALSRNGADKAAADISAAVPESAASETEQSVAENSAAEELEMFRQFWRTLDEHPWNYRACTSFYDGGATPVLSTELGWIASDQVGEPKDGGAFVKEIAEAFAAAENVEYLGFSSYSKGSTVDSEIQKKFNSGNGSSMITIDSRTGVDNNDGRYSFVSYRVFDGSAYIVIPVNNYDGENGSEDCDYYFRVTSEDGSYPHWHGTEFGTPDWYQSEQSKTYFMTLEQLRANDPESKYTVTDPTGTVSYTFSFDLGDDGQAYMRIQDITLPEGDVIVDGRAVFTADTETAVGKDSPMTAETEYNGEDELTVYIKSITNNDEPVDIDDITGLHFTLELNTSRHTAETHTEYTDHAYAYSMTGYAGIDRAADYRASLEG